MTLKITFCKVFNLSLKLRRLSVSLNNQDIYRNNFLDFTLGSNIVQKCNIFNDSVAVIPLEAQNFK